MKGRAEGLLIDASHREVLGGLIWLLGLEILNDIEAIFTGHN